MTTPVWGETGIGLDQLKGTVTADVCVVGLGGSGLSAVREALSLGCSVAGIDAGPVAGGAAGRNGGFLLAGMASFHHDLVATVGAERATSLYRLTQDEIGRMAAETPEDIRLTGSLRIAASGEELADCRRQRGVMLQHGLPATEYEGPEGEGLLFPGDGVLQPLARCRRLAESAAAGGARLYQDSPAIEISANRVVTPGGFVDCGAVVVAVDGNLEKVLPELAVDGRVRTARAQMLATEPLPKIRFPRPVYTRWGYDYYQQLPDRRLVLGGCRDRGFDAEWTDSTQPSDEVQAHLDSYLYEELKVDAAVAHRWAGLIAFTPDKLPILEEVRPGVWGCGAYSGTGNVVGSICGRLATRLAFGLPAPEAALFNQSPV